MGDISEEWTEILDRLDRHADWGQPSPDRTTLAGLMELFGVPGVGIAVGLDGGELWTAGYGTGGTTPVGPRTAFQACSISKHAAAFGTLRLVADGVLDLDADIHDYLTSWRLPGGATVTPRQLLAHTAGLSYNWFRGYGPGEAVPSLLETLDGRAPANTPPVRVSLLPGSRFRYSGSHFAVLQQLLVDVTGTPFEELMHALVLAPAGMTDSSFDQRFPHAGADSVALAHHGAGTPVPGGWRTVPEMAGAGLWSTPADLVRLELEITRALAGRSPLLGRDLAEQMVTPRAPAGAYGLGTEAGDRRFGHSGASVGYTCFSYAWPDAGAAVAVMTNSDDAREPLISILGAAGRRYATRPRDVPAPEDVTGCYLLRDDYLIEITADGGRLTLTAPDQRPAALAPLPGGGYRLPGADVEISFRRAGDQTPIVELRQEHLVEIATRRR